MLTMQGGYEHPMPVLPHGKNYVIVNATNQGREGDTFAGHLVRSDLLPQCPQVLLNARRFYSDE